MSPRPFELNSHRFNLFIYLEILAIAFLLLWNQALAFYRFLSTNWSPNQNIEQYHRSLPTSFYKFWAKQLGQAPING